MNKRSGLLAVFATVTALMTPIMATPTATASSRPSCHGHRATIVGNYRNNTIIGTQRRDVIVAGRGNDIILGRGGRDIICAGRGADTVNGGTNHDWIHGQGGGDVLEGGKAGDRLFGGTGRDLCSGENREHRYHKGCETHRDPFGNIVSPPPSVTPRTASPRALKQARSRATSSSALPPLAGRRDDPGYLAVQSPTECVRTLSNRFIRFGTVSFQTYFTNPGYVAVRPVYASYVNGWATNLTAARDWQLYYGPSDGTILTIDGGTADLPNQNAATLWGWEAYYWNGTQWANYSASVYTSYNTIGYLGLVAATGLVCI